MPSRVQRFDLAQGLLDRAPGRRVAELHLAVLEVGGRLAVGDDHDLLVRAALPGEDPAREQQPVLQVRAVLVAVPGQLGERLRPDLARVVGEPDDRAGGPAGTASGSACRARSRPSSPRRSSRAAASSGSCRPAAPSTPRRAAPSATPRSRRAQADRPAGCAGAGRVLLAHERVRQRLAEVEVERVAELVRLRRLLALAATSRRSRRCPPKASLRRRANRSSRTLLPDPPRAAWRQLHPVAVPLEIARRFEDAARGRRARRGPAPRRRPAARGRRSGRAPSRSPGVSTPRAPLRAVHRGSRSSCSSAPSRPICWSPPNRTRSPVHPATADRGSRRSCARSQRRRSSRSSASIVDWSSARCSGDSDRSSDWIGGHPLGQLFDDVVERLARPGRTGRAWRGTRRCHGGSARRPRGAARGAC